MNRRFESRGANGVDPERSQPERSQPERSQPERSQPEPREDHRYGYARPQEHRYGGFIGDHDRFAEDRDPERPRYWQREEERERYQGAGWLPPPSPLPPREVWRGRNEEYDFWGRERHPLHGEGHPSLWQRVKGAFSGKGPKNYVRSDERIREDVCEHLSYHPYIDASDIEVIVRAGEVTLTGSVDARMVKRAAEECCDQVRGVRDVHNYLRVRAQGEPAP
jgi:hypothetical protein